MKNVVRLHKILYLAILVLIYSCDKGEIPTLTTTNITKITNTSATSGGNITSDGGSEITARGVCFNTTGNPTTADTRTLDGTGSGPFISNLILLTPNTYYTLRAYATNSEGTAYGNEISFMTSEIITGTVDDIDGNTYKTVTIGNQVWMAENLKTTKYNDGTDIPNVTGLTEWKNLYTPGFCWYDNNVTYKSTYGALYNWYAAATGKLCPVGWRIPSTDQWTVLTTYLGGEYLAGDKLKEEGNEHWKNFNDAANNASGFTALPGGARIDGQFTFIEKSGAWWTSTSYNEDNAYLREMDDIVVEVMTGYLSKKEGFSVRCIKND